MRWDLPSLPRDPTFPIHILTILPSEKHSHSLGLEGCLTANHIPTHFVHTSGHMTERKWQETQLLKRGPTDRAQFLESQPRGGSQGAGQPSKGLGSVLNGGASKFTQAPAGLLLPTEDKEILAPRPPPQPGSLPCPTA